MGRPGGHTVTLHDDNLVTFRNPGSWRVVVSRRGRGEGGGGPSGRTASHLQEQGRQVVQQLLQVLVAAHQAPPGQDPLH